MNKTNLFNFLVGLLLAVLCLGRLQAAEQPLDRIAVIVDDGIIMHSQYLQRMAEVKSNLRKNGVEIPAESVLRQQVLERMIIEQIQLQIGDSMGIRIADEELNQAIRPLPSATSWACRSFCRCWPKKASACPSCANRCARK